jgi:hypothetical protein
MQRKKPDKQELSGMRPEKSDSKNAVLKIKGFLFPVRRSVAERKPVGWTYIQDWLKMEERRSNSFEKC